MILPYLCSSVIRVIQNVKRPYSARQLVLIPYVASKLCRMVESSRCTRWSSTRCGSSAIVYLNRSHVCLFVYQLLMMLGPRLAAKTMTSPCNIPRTTETSHQSRPPNMRLTLTLAFLAGSALVSATLDPAQSHTKNKCPSTYNCDATVSKAIQAAECSHNTRTHESQTFAVFVTDHQYDGNHGYPYGTCHAYTCSAPTESEMVDNGDCWTFYWK